MDNEIVLYILVIMFSDRKCGDEKFYTKWLQAALAAHNPPLISSFMQL
jgi:hypothetical protein